MNQGKHVIYEEVSASMHLLPNIFEMKNKSVYNSGLCLNLIALSVRSNLSDTIGCLHRTPKTRWNL
jgi:hypothetical protein